MCSKTKPWAPARRKPDSQSPISLSPKPQPLVTDHPGPTTIGHANAPAPVVLALDTSVPTSRSRAISFIPSSTATQLLLQDSATPLRVRFMRVSPYLWFSSLRRDFTAIQAAGIAALTGPQDHLETWRRECQRLAEEVADRLNRVPGVHCALPQGATFVFPRYPGGRPSEDVTRLLMEREGVVVTPGAGFGDCGEGHFRIALMRSPAEVVLEGTERIARVLETS